MSEIYVLRVVLDAEEDVIRDIAIESKSDLMALHHAIVAAFGLSEGEMSSFFRSNEEWDQGEELSMMDFNADTNRNVLEEIAVENAFTAKGSRMLFAYDFLNLWTFYLELLDKRVDKDGKTYPALVGKLGETPPDAPDKSMQALEPENQNGHYEEEPRDESDEEYPDDWY